MMNVIGDYHRGWWFEYNGNDDEYDKDNKIDEVNDGNDFTIGEKLCPSK